jgi:hypothetical protein
MTVSANSQAIVFVENREKTRFWAAVAKVLQARGFEIHWIVQNQMFSSGLPGFVHKLAYPRRNERDGEDCVARYPILTTDRGRQYFQAGSGHYPYYAQQISEILDSVKPCMVVGESTLFHELLAVSLSEERGIAFVHPTPERYPPNRFVMFSGSSQKPYVKSGDILSDEEAQIFSRRVREGVERPVYMKRPSGFRKLMKTTQWAVTRGRIWVARLLGERFNTPSLLRKRNLSRWAKNNLKAWRELERAVPAGSRAIMYPMQVAPEANIDVWGRPYDNQVGVLKRLISASPNDVCLAIKANPYPKYEITDELIEMARNNNRVVLLPLEISMSEAMMQSLGAITVSGTVAFEAAFGKGRCLALRHPIIEQTCPGLACSSPEEAVMRLLSHPDYGLGNDASGIALLQAITARSFKGLVSDPFSNASCMEADNVELVAVGIEAAAVQATAD